MRLVVAAVGAAAACVAAIEAAAAAATEAPPLEVPSATEAKGCTITAAACKNFPEYSRTQFRDTIGEEHLGVSSNEAACLKRAEDFHHWCGNGARDGAQVAATYNPKTLSQAYHPGACDQGWSQWDAFCYKHYWEKRNWFEAERLCRDRDSHLASVHTQAENRFIFTLTKGLSAWIGYTDLDQDTHYKWSDNTQDDFSNFAKNCTGREHEPDCKPEEKAQQWYDWQGGDAGTFVCKRNALLPVALLTNTSALNLTEMPWSKLLPALAGSIAANASFGGNPLVATTPPALKTVEVPNAEAVAAAAKGGGLSPLNSAKGAAVLEPRLGLPKGSFL